MKVYDLPRGYGKTTRLIYLSEYYQYPILCFSRAAVENIKTICRNNEIDIPEPITFQDYMSDLRSRKLRPENGVLIDEALLCLQSIIPQEIIAVTLTNEDNTVTDDLTLAKGLKGYQPIERLSSPPPDKGSSIQDKHY